MNRPRNCLRTDQRREAENFPNKFKFTKNKNKNLHNKNLKKKLFSTFPSNFDVNFSISM